MTSRVRNHILEEQSRAALRRALPDKWVIHPFQTDYGVDVQIEIFGNSGERTGIKFSAQLKATDNQQDEDGLSLDREHIEYWIAHSDPVVIFRYYAPTDEFQWRWVHDIAWRLDPDKKSVSVAGFLKPWLAENSPQEIEAFLTERRRVRLPMTWPVRVGVFDAEKDVRLAAKVARDIYQSTNNIQFEILVNTSTPTEFQVNVAKEKLAIGFCGLGGVVFHLEKNSSTEKLTSEALTGLIFCSQRYSRTEVAKAIFESCSDLIYKGAGSNLSAKHLIFQSAIAVLGGNEALRLLRPKINYESDPQTVWNLFYAAALVCATRSGNRQQWIELLRSWKEQAVNEREKATVSYNLGSALANQGRWSEARDEYMAAVAVDVRYKDQDYYWADVGAVNFELREFEVAAECYERAIKINNSWSHQWRYADALFNLGKYEKAQTLLKPGCDGRKSELELAYQALLLYVCTDLVENWGIKEQSLQKVEFSDIAPLANNPPPINAEEFEAIIRPLLLRNAIDPLLSFNSGVYANRGQLQQHALARFLACSIIHRNDVEAWANVFICAYASGCGGEVLLPIAHTAKFFCGNRFLLRLQEGVQFANDQNGLSDKWNEFVEKVMDSIQAAEKDNVQDVEIRIWSAEGGAPRNVYTLGRSPPKG